MTQWTVIVCSLIFVLLVTLTPSVYCGTVPKKLVKMGWDLRPPSYVAEHIREMEKRPFDGIFIRPTFGHTFYMVDLDEAAAEAEIEAMGRIVWRKFTENFIYFHCDDNVDWFDDSLWGENSPFLRNIGWCAKAARVGGCVGLAFDPEFVYWGRPYCAWKYEWQKHREEKSFAEYERIVRKRGAQYMDRIQVEFPDPVILTLFWTSMPRFQEAALETDPSRREAILKSDYYGLLPAFMNGMLEAAGPETIIVDGDEQSYYNNNELHYFRAYHGIHQTGLALIPPELRGKYRRQVQAGHAVYGDHLCGTMANHTEATYVSPEERALWVEHNAYWALKSSDRYVWFYSERMDWWNGRNLPGFLESALRSAKEKVAQGRPLGFDVDEIARKGHLGKVRAEARPIQPRALRVPRLRAAAPDIDGVLTDEAWNEAGCSGSFINYVAARAKRLETVTEALMTYDDTSLYVAFHCNEPEMDKTHPALFTDLGGRADQVEVVVAADEGIKAYFHIRLDLANARWDARTETGRSEHGSDIATGREVYGRDSMWSGEYRTATRKEADSWSAEFAIPWRTLGMASPKPGDRLKGNLHRWTHRRPATGVLEFSTWSETRYNRGVEFENFGTWIIE
ncbi:MAG: hypothetical protein OXR72_09805 [Gemmatimonadota bacterium]|nr:hypothetical protein [Gemmatimonadota bacterium]